MEKKCSSISIKRLLTRDTNIFNIKQENEIKFDINKSKEYNKIAKQISSETGVPQRMIYTYPTYFFIDHWYKINGEWYFYKGNGYEIHFINELLGEIISEYFGLDTIHYQIAKLESATTYNYGLISKNFCDKNCIYKTTWDYGFEPIRDMGILENIRQICSSEIEYQKLLEDLKKFFIRDFYTSQLDRTGNNFLFKNTKNGIRLAPLYDYENSFESISLSSYRNQIGELNLNSTETITLLKNDDKFQELLQLLMQANMLELITRVEDRHKIIVSEDYKEYNQKWENDIKRLILKNKLIN